MWSAATIFVVLVAGAAAHPCDWLFKYPDSCGKHPDSPHGDHQAPINDTAVTYVVTPVGANKAVAAGSPLCPGKQYTVQVNWDPMFINAVLLTTTVGNWTLQPLPGCTLSTSTNAEVNTFTDTLSLPCSAKGNITLKSTHSRPFQAYMQSQVTFNVSSTCADTKCPKPVIKKSPPPKKKPSPPPKKKSPPPKKKFSPPPAKKASPPPPKKASPPPPKK